MIYHITPWMTGDIGAGLNAAIEPLPEDATICLRDGDTLFLTPDWGARVEAIVDANPEFDLIGATCNRLRSPEQVYGCELSDDPDINNHMHIAHAESALWGTKVVPAKGDIACMCMIFKRSEWALHPFETGIITHDRRFTRAVRRHGGRVGVARGLYLFHLYRWGQPDPFNAVEHLL